METSGKRLKESGEPRTMDLFPLYGVWAVNILQSSQHLKMNKLGQAMVSRYSVVLGESFTLETSRTSHTPKDRTWSQYRNWFGTRNVPCISSYITNSRSILVFLRSLHRVDPGICLEPYPRITHGLLENPLFGSVVFHFSQ